MKTIYVASVTIALAALAGCGGKQPLKPLANQKLPAIPRGAAVAPTPAQLLKPSVQARPKRDVELLTQSDKRQDDEFDLPPGAEPR